MCTEVKNVERKDLVKEALCEQMSSLTTKRNEYKAMINKLEVSEHYERIATLQELINDIDKKFFEVLDYYTSL